MTVKRCNKTATSWQSATILVTLSGKQTQMAAKQWQVWQVRWSHQLHDSKGGDKKWW